MTAAEQLLETKRAELRMLAHSVAADASGYYGARVKRLEREIADLERSIYRERQGERQGTR